MTLSSLEQCHIAVHFTKRWRQTMDQDTETTRKSLSIFKVSIRGSLRIFNKYLYGESILAKVNTFSKLRTFLAKNLSNLAFLKRCRDNNIISKFLQLKDHLKGIKKVKKHPP